MIGRLSRLGPSLRALDPRRWSVHVHWRPGHWPQAQLTRPPTIEEIAMSDWYGEPTPVPDPPQALMVVPAEGDRPNPLGDAARTTATAWGAGSGLVGLLGTFGVLNTAQSAALDAVGRGLPGWIWALGLVVGTILPTLGAVVSAFKTKATALPGVTPVDDPRVADPDTGVLRPLVPYTGPVTTESGGRHARED